MKPLPIAALLLAILTGTAHAQATITIDTNTRFQTIEGWGHGGGIFSNMNYNIDPVIGDSINRYLLDYVIDDLGLTGSRVWEIGPRIDGTGMDNGDCDSLDWSKFYANAYDTTIAKYTVYFTNRVNALGYKTSFYSSPTYPTLATLLKPWVLNHPGERAQQIIGNALWWKKWGIDMNYAATFNEPGSPVTEQIMIDDLKVAGPRMAALGLPTKVQWPEAVAPSTAWNFIAPEIKDSDLWPWVGRLSYHNYGGADPYRSQIRDFGLSKGIPTGQTEMGNPSINDIYNDLTLGGVTYWEVGFAGGTSLPANSGLTAFTPSSTYFPMRQVIHYIRPGAVRVGSTTTDSNVRVLAFNRNGSVTTVVINGTSTKTVNLVGIPPGQYGLSQANPGTGAFQELGVQTVGAPGTLSMSIAGSGSVTTLYPYEGSNHPPTIMSIGASPGYVVAPGLTTTLSVRANDAELDPLKYNWSVFSQPTGANALIASPTSPSTVVNAMLKPGTYVFQASVNDGEDVTTRKVYVVAYASNPPPTLGPAGFRIAAPYGLVFANPGEVTHANVELPTSAVTLQVGIGDLANSSFAGRGKWTLVSQPVGANMKLDTTIYIFVSIRAQASNMTVPGDYVFQCNVTVPGSADLVTQIICTVHPASSGPIINSIAANPSTLTLPVNSTELSAQTTDPTGQLLRQWWVVKSTPAGAKPVFDHQGRTTSNVSGLTVPGSYTFTLRSFDDIHTTMKDVTVLVKQSSGWVGTGADGIVGLEIYPNPAAKRITVAIEDPNDRVMRIVVSNTVGQMVQSTEIPDGGASVVDVSLESLTAGMYFVTVQTRSGIQTRKIVKQ